MDINKLLKEELEKRYAQDQKRQSDISRLVEIQQKAAENLPVEMRQDLSPRVALVDELTGSNLSRSYQAPEDVKTSLRKALAYKLQQPKSGFTDMLKAKMMQDSAMAKLAAKQGPRQLSASDVMKVQEGENIPMMLEDVDQVIDANASIFGPVEGRARQLNPYDTQGKTVEAQMRAASQAFGRFMEGGVLRKEDEEKYRRMFPNLSDTPAVAKNKLEVVKRLMKQRQAGNVSALGKAGFDVSPFAGGGQGAGIVLDANGEVNSMDLTQMSDAELKKLAGM